MDPLYDNEFLQELFAQRNREIYGRITSLNFDEYPLEEITGRITNGSINVDGSSASRRTCSVTMVAQDVNINDFYWGLNTKFKFEVGLVNTFNNKYPDIIWFKQGIFVITTFSTALTTNSYTIQIQGKDKMCLLDGSIGGALTALSYDFGTEDYTNEYGIVTNTPMLIRDIVAEAVHEYAGEPWENIVVQGLDDYGVELLQYRGPSPMYIIIDKESKEIYDYTLDDTYVVYADGKNITNVGTLGQDGYIYDERINLSDVKEPTAFSINKDQEAIYNISRVNPGDTCGYRMVDIIYKNGSENGKDLVSNVGESITSMLDKLCTFLGNFEYFYDIDGKFMFRPKPLFINKSWNTEWLDKGVKTEEDAYRDWYQENANYISPTIWNFNNSNLVSSFNNTPNLANLRNDYSIWGTRKGSDGSELPVHLRYAINNKPHYYRSVHGANREYMTKDEYELRRVNKIAVSNDCLITDWRELIYQMAIDYRRFNHENDFRLKVRQVNGKDSYGQWIYPKGVTGYEPFYIDMEGFWRQIYCPKGEYVAFRLSSETANQYKTNYYIRAWSTGTEDNPYLADIIYTKPTEEQLNNMDASALFYYQDDWSSRDYWCQEKVDSPEALNFWIDFIEGDVELQKYYVSAIGDRSKAINDSSIKSIYFRETPLIIFAEKGTEDKERKLGYSYLFYDSNLINMFVTSSQGKDSFDVLYENLYNYAYCVETASITVLPIYHLEPNSLITLYDKDTGINGTYIIKSFNIPLNYNGLMTISATKYVEEIY